MKGKKKNILFVGSFLAEAKDGSVGGQMYACRTLLASDLSKYINWVTIDTTASSNITPPFVERLLKAISRLIRFVYHLLFSGCTTVLIFTADGFSFVEKGTMSLLAKAVGKRTILAPRSGFILRDLEKGGSLKQFIRFVLRQVDIVVCQGQRWQQWFIDLTEQTPDKFVLIPNWLDLQPYLSLQRSNIDANTAHILFLSWVDAQKGIFDLIEAIHVLPKHLNFTCHIAGAGSALEEARQKVQSLELTDYCHFEGWAKSKAKMKLLAKADIYVLPSYFEGYPNSLLEAMASGLAVVSTPVGAIPEIIQSGENGYLVTPGDVAQLAQTLQQLIQDESLRKALGQKAQQDVSVNNDLQQAIATWQTIL